MKWSGDAPCQCHSPGGVRIVSPGRISTTVPPFDWIRPSPSMTCKVCPTACACQALRAPGANRTTLTRRRDGSSPLAMTSNHASPVNVSAGALTVGCFSWISIGYSFRCRSEGPDCDVSADSNHDDVGCQALPLQLQLAMLKCRCV